MIQENTIVKVIYDLYVDGEQPGQEELMERATEEHPLEYIHGLGMMLPLFEAGMEGKAEGDTFDFRIKAVDAYGEYDEQGVLSLDKEMFYIDGKFDEERVFVGNIVPMTTTDGQIVRAQVVEITDKAVTIDLNHPLAGENLHFIGKVISVRPATEEELAALTKGCGGCCGGGSCSNGDCSNGCEGGNCQGCN